MRTSIYLNCWKKLQNPGDISPFSEKLTIFPILSQVVSTVLEQADMEWLAAQLPVRLLTNRWIYMQFTFGSAGFVFYSDPSIVLWLSCVRSWRYNIILKQACGLCFWWKLKSRIKPPLIRILRLVTRWLDVVTGQLIIESLYTLLLKVSKPQRHQKRQFRNPRSEILK